MNDLRFEASFYEGEDGERLPNWHVVEWDTIVRNADGSVKAKSGNIVWKTYDMIDGEIDAIQRAYQLNTEYYCGA